MQTQTQTHMQVASGMLRVSWNVVVPRPKDDLLRLYDVAPIIMHHVSLIGSNLWLCRSKSNQSRYSSPKQSCSVETQSLLLLINQNLGSIVPSPAKGYLDRAIVAFAQPSTIGNTKCTC